MKTPCAVRAGLVLGSLMVACVSREPLGAEPRASHLDSRSTGGAAFRAGDLELILRPATNGIALESLADVATQTVLATTGAPLFEVTVRQVSTRKDQVLRASEGWREATVRPTRGGLALRWAKPEAAGLEGLVVHATAQLDAKSSAIRWHLRLENANADASVWRVVFPQLRVPELGERGAVLFPRGPGEVQRGVWEQDFHYHGNYPGGWCSMQFMAAYREGEPRTGLYVGLHDPWGGTKDLDVRSDPTTRAVRFLFDVPAPDMGRAGNGFELEGAAVWQLLRGDWFDAAMVYKGWARRAARWWPQLGREGRRDTPPWMRELSAWVMSGGAPGDCLPAVKTFRAALGRPTGLHWYNWHQIPFDNDYPHYFPTKPGFAGGVAELQRQDVFVMPYINGRLWDSHDRGAEDFEFTRVALPAATKQANGEPYLESYGSKETNGQPVRLAAMCPATALWQARVAGIVSRLLRDEGTRAVYIDQVAAAAPTLCLDSRHGHPLGGGHWWNQGYWAMLEGIRRAMPPDRMLTTECNGEPFIRWFDGYLTWHWQHDGQVPAFPAVYGGAIQMFGRAYRGGDTKDLAFRMKAAQQLVFGEQIGWFDPPLATEPPNLEFVRKAVHTRDRFRRYFHAGEMARPPKLEGDMPKVKADWQWSGTWWVTTDAVLAGAWQLRAERRLVLLFANPSDQAVPMKLRLEGQAYGLPGRTLRCQVSRDAGAPGEVRMLRGPVAEAVSFAPRSVQAWELRW